MKQLRPPPARKQDPYRKHLIAASVLLAAAVLLFAAAVCFLFWGGQLLGESPEQPASFCYRLGVYEDRLAVYTGSSTRPDRILDIPLSSLPEGDQLLLQQGIDLDSEEALRQAIEDFF